MNHISTSNTHIFALFYEPLSTIMNDQSITMITINDEAILHRIEHVLRLAHDDIIIIFDHHIAIRGSIKKFTKKSVVVDVTYKTDHAAPIIDLTIWLPILKKDDFETALSELSTLQINTIVPIITKKSRACLDIPPARLHKIIIAAAEQSKNFRMPHLATPIALDKALQTLSNYSGPPHILLDQAGIPLHSYLAHHHPQSSMMQKDPLIILAGPEAALTQDEINRTATFFRPCSLVSSVLKTHHALFLAAGITENWYHN